MKRTLCLWVFTGAVLMAVFADVSAWASDSAPSLPAPHANIYSDPPPGNDGSYHPNYVAPSAPPPIYTDTNAGTYCREYSRKMRIEGHMQENYGVTCLQPDGSWRIMK